MAIATSHPHIVQSISAKADAQAFRALALDLESDPLSVPPELYMTREARIAAFCEFRLNGAGADLSPVEWAYVQRLDVHSET